MTVAALYADEDVPAALVARLRVAGHDLLTATEAGRANLAIPDAEQLVFATSAGRAILTMNRNDFSQLHRASREHGGIVTCTRTLGPAALAVVVVEALAAAEPLAGRLLRVRAGGWEIDAQPIGADEGPPVGAPSAISRAGRVRPL